MDQKGDPRELQRQLDQAQRLASGVGDQTTLQRIREFADELKKNLQRILSGRRSKHAIKARARELWEQNGRPTGRDVEFWLQAERELTEDAEEGR
jgi:ABC-type siderophore export system fused ATPase/permease subunit